MSERLVPFDITMQLGHALHILAESGEATMSSFASNMFCDASNATGLIDRLAARGLVERRPSELDRRAKVVRLTPAGRRLERRIDDMMMSEAPPAVARLSAADQRTLREILERALAFSDEPAPRESA